LTDGNRIAERLDAIEELLAAGDLIEQARTELNATFDLQRLVSRVTTGRASPRDLESVSRTLALLPRLKAQLTGRRSALLHGVEVGLDLCPDLRGPLEAALVEGCPLVAKDGGVIRTGFHPQLDELRDLARGGKQWIAQYQTEQQQRTGISSLRVGYNQVFGFYLEVTNVHREKIPPDFIRKQTLKNAERYITPELKDYEEKVLTAEAKAKDLEYEIFCQMRDLVHAASARLRRTAEQLALLDVLTSLADLARRQGYVRPQVDESGLFDIRDGRHPVLDTNALAGTLVPNDTQAGGPHGQIVLITGPNMAGKSTYIRQVALITIMAQMGSYVPAASARIGLADRVFARVGASDELSRGMSTFMVEMTETARILNTATRHSLVILDEIGRGTSTYDGISLAWSIVEYLHDRIGCRVFFATHYHELTGLEKPLVGVRNWTVAVRESEGHVVFLYKVVPGAADRSYGIHVARLAGIPSVVNQRAEEILAELECDEVTGGEKRKRPQPSERRGTGDVQLLLFDWTEHPLLEEIRTFRVDDTPPLEALRQIKGWQESLATNK
ncbi:MAG TPA: DNA mismatch repair protein MutS, partial [Pirellulaceae bacterium]